MNSWCKALGFYSRPNIYNFLGVAEFKQSGAHPQELWKLNEGKNNSYCLAAWILTKFAFLIYVLTGTKKKICYYTFNIYK